MFEDVVFFFSSLFSLSICACMYIYIYIYIYMSLSWSVSSLLQTLCVSHTGNRLSSTFRSCAPLQPLQLQFLFSTFTTSKAISNRFIRKTVCLQKGQYQEECLCHPLCLYHAVVSCGCLRLGVGDTIHLLFAKTTVAWPVPCSSSPVGMVPHLSW